MALTLFSYPNPKSHHSPNCEVTQIIKMTSLHPMDTVMGVPDAYQELYEIQVREQAAQVAARAIMAGLTVRHKLESTTSTHEAPRVFPSYIPFQYSPVQASVLRLMRSQKSHTSGTPALGHFSSPAPETVEAGHSVVFGSSNPEIFELQMPLYSSCPELAVPNLKFEAPEGGATGRLSSPVMTPPHLRPDSPEYASPRRDLSSPTMTPESVSSQQNNARVHIHRSDAASLSKTPSYLDISTSETSIPLHDSLSGSGPLHQTSRVSIGSSSSNRRLNRRICHDCRKSFDSKSKFQLHLVDCIYEDHDIRGRWDWNQFPTRAYSRRVGELDGLAIPKLTM